MTEKENIVLNKFIKYVTKKILSNALYMMLVAVAFVVARLNTKAIVYMFVK